MKLVLDFETFFDTKYSLKKLNVMEYVNHPDFTVQGVAVKELNVGDKAEWISEDDVEDYLQSIDWDNTELVCHHTDFDAYILSQVFGLKPRFHYDTMAMSRGRFPGKAHTLAALVERLFPDDPSIRKGTELIQAKGTKHLTGDLDATIGSYACNDVEITEHAFNHLIKDYPEAELRIIDMVCRMFTQPRLRLDRDRTVAFRNTSKETSDAKITASTLDREVLSSNDKFAEYITNTLKLDVPMKQGKNKLIPAFGKNDIAFQRLQAEHPEFKHIWDARLASKSRIDVTRSDRFLNGTNKDGTISMPLRYYAAHTGRFGGGEKMNPQNLKRGSELRKALVAPDGYMVVVADKSQIEARLTAWLAGCSELVEAFRDGRDVYSEFASKIYNKVVTKEDKIPRFVGKTAVLALGFGTGHKKLQSTLESGAQGPVVIMTEEEAKKVVTTYRSEYWQIPALWKKLESSMIWLQNNRFTGMKYGPLVAGKNEWILPNGMSMQYPELDGLSFYDARFKVRKTIWGGVVTENCIAEDTEVLTSNGWKKIQNVTNTDLVHDGVDWVTNGGVVSKSVQSCITVDGVYMTPDHKVLTNDGWKAAQTMPEPIRPNIRELDCNPNWPNKREETLMDLSMQMRKTDYKSRNRNNKTEQARRNSKLRLSNRQSNVPVQTNPWHEQASGLRSVESYARPLSFTFASSMEKLRRAGHKSVRAMAEIIRKLLERYGINVSTRLGLRPQKQQRELHTRELPLDNATKKLTKQTNYKNNHRTFNSSQSTRNQSNDPVLQNSPQLATREMANKASPSKPVYDILNCGPRHRFVVKGNNGPFIVHNCIQALARVNICEDMLAIEDWIKENNVDAMISLQVHDEVICVCEESRAQELYQAMLRIMATPAKWAPDLPLKAEGGIAKEYSK